MYLNNKNIIGKSGDKELSIFHLDIKNYSRIIYFAK